MKLSNLKDDPKNPRKISERSLSALQESIETFGDISGIVYNKRTKELVCGHQRKKAILEKYGDCEIILNEDGDPTEIVIDSKRTVNIRVVDWDAKFQRLANIAANNKYIAGEFTEDAIPIMAELEIEYPDLSTELLIVDLKNETISDLNYLEEIKEGNADPDDIPEDAPSICEKGDIWILGENRLLCGDCTKAEDVKRVMGGEKADVLFTSPPYGLGKTIKLRGNANLNKQESAYLSHDDDPKDWAALMVNFWETTRNYCSSTCVNVQMLANNKIELIKWIADRSAFLCDIAIWDKQNAAPAMASGVFSSRYELLLFFSEENASRKIPYSSWRGTVSNVFIIGRQSKNDNSDIHGATMPVELPLTLFKEVHNKCKSILDPFCGTGTTIIAAEQLNRKCYAIEIEPKYCDVSIKRWEEFTGKKAVKI